MDMHMSSSAFRCALRDRTRELSDRLDGLGTPPGLVAYNPLAYARAAHERYLDLFGGPRRIVFVGMNPGPWGMVQTGVPFGNVEHARTILGLGSNFPIGPGDVRQPARTLDDRPVHGFACARDEVSGRRFWSGLAPLWIKPGDEKIQPEPPGRFFGSAGRTQAEVDALQFTRQIARMLGEVFVMNLCPQAFFDAHSSKPGAAPNVTPDKLKPPVWRDRLVGDASPCRDYCDFALRHFQPEAIVVMGDWVEKTVRKWNPAARVVRLPHPSPANPKANRGWAEAAQKVMRDAGLVG
jgi:single-strand selective monofunctional uracil DNA glycosylase